MLPPSIQAIIWHFSFFFDIKFMTFWRSLRQKIRSLRRFFIGCYFFSKF